MGSISGSSLKAQSKLFGSLGDESRLSILLAMQNGARTVGQIVATTGLSQSNVSNHLACLRDCGLVDCEKDGRLVRYWVAVPRLWDLLVGADEILKDKTQQIQACANFEDAHVG